MAPEPQRPDTIAKSLAIGDPADGIFALSQARETGGSIDSVTDDEIRAVEDLANHEVLANALVILAACEVDEAFANIYSTATSAQNVAPPSGASDGSVAVGRCR